jgi:hypothetical protein
VAVLKRKFGKVGESLHFMGLGVDTSPVVPDEEAEAVKSVGHSMRDIDRSSATCCSFPKWLAGGPGGMG